MEPWRQSARWKQKAEADAQEIERLTAKLAEVEAACLEAQKEAVGHKGDG
ncbi:MAG: hypothetical protein IPK73_30425 [Candidatus Obscuribacter sp.]|nr:hypothetical protein [Candidatus Obscuribacter sp.]